MFAHRAAYAMAGVTAVTLSLVVFTAPATAQVAEGTVMNILRECARIDDPSARLACYDNNMRNAGGPVRATVPGQVQVQGGGAAIVRNNNPAGFGREDIPSPDRFNAAAAGAAEITAEVASVDSRGAGIYAITLVDGAEWVFAEGVGNSYRPPRRGARVEIRRGSMDSFLLRYDGQTSVRVRRVR
jgi:hypothetical protein